MRLRRNIDVGMYLCVGAPRDQNMPSLVICLIFVTPYNARAAHAKAAKGLAKACSDLYAIARWSRETRCLARARITA